MKEKMFPTRMLLTNMDLLSDEEVNEYNEIHETNLTSGEIASEIATEAWEDFFANLKYSPYNNETYAIYGTIGRWNGRFEIELVKCDNLKDVIKRAIGTCDFFKVTQKYGHIEVVACHHDGTNYLNISLLNEKGLNTKGDLSKSCYHKRIKGYLI